MMVSTPRTTVVHPSSSVQGESQPVTQAAPVDSTMTSLEEVVEQTCPTIVSILLALLTERTTDSPLVETAAQHLITTATRTTMPYCRAAPSHRQALTSTTSHDSANQEMLHLPVLLCKQHTFASGNRTATTRTPRQSNVALTTRVQTNLELRTRVLQTQDIITSS